MGGVQGISDLNLRTSAPVRFPDALPAMSCFSVRPSISSMAMKVFGHPLRRFRRWCRC